MNNQSQCPDRDQLLALLDETLADEQLPTVQEHVDSCTDCQQAKTMNPALRLKQQHQHPGPVKKQAKAPPKCHHLIGSQRPRIPIAFDLFDTYIALTDNELPQFKQQERWSEEKRKRHSMRFSQTPLHAKLQAVPCYRSGSLIGLISPHTKMPGANYGDGACAAGRWASPADHSLHSWLRLGQYCGCRV